MFTNFEYVTLFSCLNKRNIFHERSILIEQLWLWHLTWLKGLFTNFECLTFFSWLKEKNIFHKMSCLEKTSLTRNNWEKWCSKSVRVIYIIFSFICYIKMDFSWKMFLLLRHEKNFIYSKLVNNTFKYIIALSVAFCIISIVRRQRSHCKLIEDRDPIHGFWKTMGHSSFI